MKLILNTIVTALLFSQTGFAMPGVALAEKILAKRSASMARQNGRTAHCVNLAGNWKGRCTAGDVTEDAAMEIKQIDCTTILFGHTGIYVGALENHSAAQPLGDMASLASAVTSAHDWSADGTQLNSWYVGLFKVIGTPPTTPFSGMTVTRLEGGKLVSESVFADLKISCSFDKQ